MKNINKFGLIVACIAMIGIGVGADFSYQSVTDRPGNFAMTDTASVSGWNSFQASTFANAGGVSEMTQVKALPVPTASGFSGAPEEKSSQCIYMEFTKDGTTVDPAVQETVISDITVGSVSTTTVPTMDSVTGNLVGSTKGAGYDLFTSTVGGVAGTPIKDANNKLIGISDDYQRYVFANVQSVQDDYISATGKDSAGTNSIALTSWTTASVGSPTMPENTPYVQFDWQDMRGYRVDVNGVAFSGLPEWTIQNSAFYQEILPGDYRTGKYL